jgi:dihydrolipoamide dehydrogenase
VTVVEVLDRVLPVEDEEISDFARKSFEKQGIKIHTGATVSALERNGENVIARIEGGGQGSEFAVERVILAVGIVGNVEDIGLEDTGVVVERSHVVVDEWLRTGEPGVYAIGDLVGPPWLAHKAMHEGVVCVERIAGVNAVHPLDHHNIPSCTYCRPQVASVGLTEKAAREAGHEVKIGHFPFIGNGKAIALGEPEGMVKTIFLRRQDWRTVRRTYDRRRSYRAHPGLHDRQDPGDDRIGADPHDLPHPTLSETMHEAVLAAYGRAIHF